MVNDSSFRRATLHRRTTSFGSGLISSATTLVSTVITGRFGLAVRDTDALLAAAGEVGFPIGHASAQLGWRGLRSRPTWRILLYSGEDPPAKRGLVLVDAVDGRVLDHIIEDNPEDWS